MINVCFALPARLIATRITLYASSVFLPKSKLPDANAAKFQDAVSFQKTLMDRTAPTK